MPETNSTPIHRQFSKYVSAGFVSAGTDFTLYTILVRAFSVTPLIANLISRPAGGLVSFLINRQWTFGARGRERAHIHFVRFWIVWVASFFISELFVGFYHEIVHFGPVLSKISAEGAAGFFTFMCHRHWTFK
jgi:putative flippase GtrA